MIHHARSGFGKGANSITGASTSTKTQATATKYFISVLHPNTINTDIIKRLNNWLPATAIIHNIHRIVNDIFGTCRSLKNSFITMSLFRTWLNAWSTTYRKHETPTTCKFGCSCCPDRITHYLVCPVLIQELFRLIPPSVPIRYL